MAYKDKTPFDDNRIKLDFHRAEIDLTTFYPSTLAKNIQS